MQFPENQVSRTDSFTLNVNRLPRISTLSYYPSEARKGRCFRFGHQPNTNVEVSQDAEFRTKLWKVPCNILPSYADKFVSGNSDLSSVNKYRGQMPEQHIRKINKKMGKVSYEVRRRQQEQTQQMLFSLNRGWTESIIRKAVNLILASSQSSMGRHMGRQEED